MGRILFHGIVLILYFYFGEIPVHLLDELDDAVASAQAEVNRLTSLVDVLTVHHRADEQR